MTVDPFQESAALEAGETQDSAVAARPPSGLSWLDQDEILRSLWNGNKTPEEIAEHLHRSIAAIMTRAARLGLPRRTAPGRKRGYKRTDPPRRVPAPRRIRVALPVEVEEEEPFTPPQITMRICLMCLNKFQSLGRFNRICPGCKGSAEYSTGSSTPDFTFSVSN